MTQKLSILGQYRPGDSYFHLLDSRFKILSVLFLMVLSLFTSSILFYSLMIALVFAALFLSKIDSRTIIKNLKPILLIVLITILYHIIFSSKEGEALFSISFFIVTKLAVYKAIFYSERLVLFILLAFLITFTSSPSQLGEAIVKLLSPLKKLKVPVNDIGLILFMAMRFIPILFEEFRTIKQAQMVRGVDFGGSFLNRVKKISSLLIPVFTLALKRADDLALAMAVRGYSKSEIRTFYSTTNITNREILYTLFSTLTITLLFVYL